MLAQRRRRWANIKQALAQHLVFDGIRFQRQYCTNAGITFVIIAAQVRCLVISGCKANAGSLLAQRLLFSDIVKAL